MQKTDLIFVSIFGLTVDVYNNIMWLIVIDYL